MPRATCQRALSTHGLASRVERAADLLVPQPHHSFFVPLQRTQEQLRQFMAMPATQREKLARQAKEHMAKMRETHPGLAPEGDDSVGMGCCMRPASRPPRAHRVPTSSRQGNPLEAAMARLQAAQAMIEEKGLDPDTVMAE